MNSNLLLILFCLVLGRLLKQTGRFPANGAKTFNSFVIYVSLPAVILVQIPKLVRDTTLSADLFIPISMAWILFGASVVAFLMLGKKFGWSKSQTGALALTAGLGNTSFVGLPLIETILGPNAIPIALLIDQAGSFLVLASVGIIFASIYSPRSDKGPPLTVSKVVKSILTFPPFMTLIASLILGLSSFALSPNALSVFERLGATLVPVALVSVGFQLKISPTVLKQKWQLLAYGLTFKLFLAPLFFLALFHAVFQSNSFSTHVTLLEAAMAPMITAGIVAEDFEFDAELANLMIGIGIPLSLLTVFLWQNVFLRMGFQN